MPESGRRVVLLARPGPARDRVRAALVEVGAELALEADPTQAGVDDVAAACGEVVLVVLDSATEAALDRFDAVLLDPAIDVMYEEADLAANRSGWDAARWTRHLAAKLHGHADVLPPGRTAVSDSGSVARAAPAADEEVPVSTRASEDAAPAAVIDASDPSADAVVAEPMAPVMLDFDPHADIATGTYADPDLGAADATVVADALEFDPLSSPIASAPPHPLSDEFAPGVEPGAYAGFDPVAAEMTEFEFEADQVIAFDPSLREDFVAPGSDVAPESSGFDLAFESELTLPGIAPAPVPLDLSRFDELSLDDLRGGPALPPADLPAPAFDVLAEVATPDAAASPFAGLSDDHVLSLVADDEPLPAPVPTLAATRLADLEQRIASLSLVEEAPAVTGDPPARGDALEDAASIQGAVLLIAGLGGPDAVRQVLGALPEAFPRPVLVQQRLDGGRYDRLVTQLQRATSLPVDLADIGGDVRSGVVHVLPEGIGLVAGPEGLRFGDGDPLDALPMADSAVLLLSGADATLAERLVAAGWSQALVAGQAADGCYDATASNALATHGRPTAAPAELARQLIERWNA